MSEAFEQYNQMMAEGRVAAIRQQADAARQCYEAAKRYAGDWLTDEEAAVAEAARLGLERAWPQAEALLTKVSDNPASDCRNLALFYLGSVRRGQKAYDEAIRLYEQAVVELLQPWHCWTLNNLGDLYELKAVHGPEDERAKCLDLALKYHEQAYRTGGVPNAYVQRYNYARLLVGHGRLEEAIKQYQAARDEARECDLDFCGVIGRDLGTTFFKRSILDRQLREGTVVLDTVGLDLAIKTWEQARKDFHQAHHRPVTVDASLRVTRPGEVGGSSGTARFDPVARAAVVTLKLRYLEDFLARQDVSPPAARLKMKENSRFRVMEWMPPNAVRPDGYSSVEERMVARIIAVKHDSYATYAKWGQDTSLEQESDQPLLAVLRDWSSSLPYVERVLERPRNDAELAAKRRTPTECRGGGYFLRWRGKGLIIDPGIDFLLNFQEARFHFNQVDGIVISHNHPDHNMDLKALDDLCYELYRRAGRDDRKAKPRTLILDGDTHAVWKVWHPDPGEARHFRNKISFDAGLYRAEDGADENDIKAIPLSLESYGLPFCLRYFRVDHGNDVRHAVGFTVECLPEKFGDLSIKIGFTCDTRYFDRLCQPDHLGEVDILVAHISQPDEAELLIEEECKAGPHLGYRGVEKLIKKCRPALTIIGEYWGGLADLRLDIAAGLREACGPDAMIVPSSRALRINPQAQKIYCTQCGAWVSFAGIEAFEPDIKLGPFKYVCESCPRPPGGSRDARVIKI